MMMAIMICFVFVGCEKQNHIELTSEQFFNDGNSSCFESEEFVWVESGDSIYCDDGRILPCYTESSKFKLNFIVSSIDTIISLDILLQHLNSTRIAPITGWGNDKIIDGIVKSGEFILTDTRIEIYEIWTDVTTQKIMLNNYVIIDVLKSGISGSELNKEYLECNITVSYNRIDECISTYDDEISETFKNVYLEK